MQRGRSGSTDLGFVAVIVVVVSFGAQNTKKPDPNATRGTAVCFLLCSLMTEIWRCDDPLSEGPWTLS